MDLVLILKFYMFVEQSHPQHHVFFHNFLNILTSIGYFLYECINLLVISSSPPYSALDPPSPAYFV
jgi:hypothetical protein